MRLAVVEFNIVTIEYVSFDDSGSVVGNDEYLMFGAQNTIYIMVHITSNII